MKKRLLLLAATTIATSGCYEVENAQPSGVGSFQVVVKGITAVNTSGPPQSLDVVPSCIKRYGNSLEQVPADVRGTQDCPYVAPNGPVELTLDVTALDKKGQPFDFNGPVALHVEPGELAGDYSYYWMPLKGGRGTDTVRAQYIYGEVRVWVKDERFEPKYVDGGVLYYTDKGDKDPQQFPQLDAGHVYSYAAGASGPVFFAEPTLSFIQRPQVADNRSSPFVGRFVTIGRAPESGSVLYQNCQDIDVDGDGEVDVLPPKPVTLLVTGTDPSGFYVTDITACPVPDSTEPSGYLPGTFGSMFVYNYSFPEGLYPGDLLWTLAGSIQEFTSTTQLTFPSWTVREHVRELPPEQWNKYMELRPPVELNLRHCGLANSLSPGGVDRLCGYYTDNMKMESLESSLVKARHVRFPEIFKSCDTDGNGEVTFFCSSRGAWTYCGSTAPSNMDEVQCNIDCTTGTGTNQNKVCSERTSYNGFGQFVIELAGPGPREAGLDDSLPERTQLAQQVVLSDTSSHTLGSAGEAVSIWCEVATSVRFGATAADVAKATYTTLPARTRKYGEGYVDFKAQETPSSTSAPKCYVAQNNAHTRMLLTTRDAVPELRVDCDENDSDADRAQQCRLMHQATYDVVGHLKQIQAARPRWLIAPRDADDLCCHPGPEGQCPRPIKPCQ